MKLTTTQLETLIGLIQETHMVEFFEKTDQYGLKTPEISLFRKEFIGGKYSFDFYERLEAYIRSLANPQETPNFSQKQNPTNMKIQNSSKIENGNNNVGIQNVKDSKIHLGDKKGTPAWLIALIVLAILGTFAFVFWLVIGLFPPQQKTEKDNTQKTEKEQTTVVREDTDKGKKSAVHSENSVNSANSGSDKGGKKETYFTVTLKDENGKILGTRQVKKGASLQTFSVEGYKESDPYLIEKDTEITLETN